MKCQSGWYCEDWNNTAIDNRDCGSTVIQIAARERLRIATLEVAFDGTGGAAKPVKISLEIQNKGQFNETHEDDRLSCIRKKETAAPEIVRILNQFYWPAFGGLITYPFPPNEGLEIDEGECFGIRAYYDHHINCYGRFYYEYDCNCQARRKSSPCSR